MGGREGGRTDETLEESTVSLGQGRSDLQLLLVESCSFQSITHNSLK